MDSQWLYKINLQISEDESWEGVKNLCNSAMSEIKRIMPLIEKSKISEKETLIGQLEDALNDFDMRLLDEQDMQLEDSINECNYLLENLYDLADFKPTINGIRHKFIWINKI